MLKSLNLLMALGQIQSEFGQFQSELSQKSVAFLSEFGKTPVRLQPKQQGKND